MAEERGAFPIYEASKEINNPMIIRIRTEDPELYARMIKSGRRNISMLTIAPTGTTSLMTQTTSGIEPVFRPFYLRRKKVNPNDQNVKISYRDDMGTVLKNISYSITSYYLGHDQWLRKIRCWK